MTKQNTKLEKQGAQDLVQEEQKMDEEIERLEGEARELKAPASAISWDELQAGATEKLEKRERRRWIPPHMMV